MSTEGHFCDNCGCDEGPHGCVCGWCDADEEDFYAALQKSSHYNRLFAEIRNANAVSDGPVNWSHWQKLLIEGVANEFDRMLADWTGEEIAEAIKIVSRLAHIQRTS